jgi:hypothetical protein
MGGWGGGGVVELVQLTTSFSTTFHHISFDLGSLQGDNLKIEMLKPYCVDYKAAC